MRFQCNSKDTLKKAGQYTRELVWFMPKKLAKFNLTVHPVLLHQLTVCNIQQLASCNIHDGEYPSSLPPSTHGNPSSCQHGYFGQLEVLQILLVIPVCHSMCHNCIDLVAQVQLNLVGLLA